MDIAIDLGTANTLIYLRDRGVVLNQPSIVALNPKGDIVAIGHEALLMHEKTHSNIRTVKPLQGGVIADYGIAEMMIRELVKKVKKNWFMRTRNMFVCIPTGITDVERMAVRDSAKHAGARKVYLVEETVAAAIGIGMDVNEPVGNMIVDIGGGTTEIAIISLAGTVYSNSLRIGGDKLNEDIVSYFRRSHNLLIGLRTAEKVKFEIGSATPLDPELEMMVKGRDLVSGFPKHRVATSKDVRNAISESINGYVEAIKKSLEQTPPELASDILDRGITLTGGGALLRNLDVLIQDAIGLPIHIAEDPLTAVVRGTGMILEDLDQYKYVIT
ncbi:MAG: rod shape-determining protein [Balneolaceae bacterium]